MIIQIFRNNLEVLQVKPSDSSELSQKKQSEDIIRLSFVLVTFVELQIGDYIISEKTEHKYILNKKPRVTEDPANYQYECIFEGPLHELRKTKIMLLTPKGAGTYYRDYKFPLTGNAQTLLAFVVSNLNRNGGDYVAGKSKNTEITTIDVNNWTALETIYQISTLLSVDWYLEGRILNFDSPTITTAFVFQVGRKLGFSRLTRTRVDSEDIESVVYGYGATKNLPPRINYDGELLTENRLSFSGVGGQSKLEKNVSKYGRIESIQEFDTIFPQRTATVTGVISGDIFSFYDLSMNFDINTQLLPGVKPKISFLSGKLIGLNFNILFDYASKKYTLEVSNDNGGPYPNAIQFPAVGDSYTLFDIALPQAYITDAQVKLKQATQDYIDIKSKGLELYEGDIDPDFILINKINLFLGNLVRVVSPTFKIDDLYEIKELVQNINNPNVYTVKFGDVLPKNLIAQLKNVNFANQQSLYNIQKNTYTTNEVNNISNQTIEWETL